jgi:hypothetical protein
VYSVTGQSSLFESCTEHPPCTEKTGFHGADGDIEHVRNLVQRQLPQIYLIDVISGAQHLVALYDRLLNRLGAEPTLPGPAEGAPCGGRLGVPMTARTPADPSLSKAGRRRHRAAPAAAGWTDVSLPDHVYRT